MNNPTMRTETGLESTSEQSIIGRHDSSQEIDSRANMNFSSLKNPVCTRGECRKPVRLVEGITENLLIYFCDSCDEWFGTNRSPTETTACQKCVSIACPEKQIEKRDIPTLCCEHANLDMDKAIKAIDALSWRSK